MSHPGASKRQKELARLSEEQKKFTPLNAELAKIWPVITDAKPGPADADQWKDVKDKLKLLER